jgi:integrase
LDKTAVVPVPRPVIDAKLDTRTARARLAPRGKPYWRGIDHGLHIGYRKGVRAGQWVARVYLGAQQYRVETLGTADDRAEADGLAVLNWRQAQARAREQQAALAREQAGLEPEEKAAGPYTVNDALDDYLKWFATHRRSLASTRTRIDAQMRPALGKVEVARLSAKRIRDWHEELARTPARLRRSKGAAQRYRFHNENDPEAVRRRRATANRLLATFKAALNHAWREGKVPADAAWRRVAPFKDVDAARVRYLQLAECTRLINACPPDFRRMVEAALLTGMRYGELCALDVGDFNADAGTVHVRRSKAGGGRHVVLTAEGESFFAAITAGRAGSEPLLLRADGDRWGRSHQHRPLAEACRRAGIEPMGFHGLRHTYASLAIMAGVPLMVVARNLGHSDTRMCERHYGHLAESFVRTAIRAGVPSFGVTVDSTVTPLARPMRSV